MKFEVNVSMFGRTETLTYTPSGFVKEYALNVWDMYDVMQADGLIDEFPCMEAFAEDVRERLTCGEDILMESDNGVSWFMPVPKQVRRFLSPDAMYDIACKVYNGEEVVE